MKKDSYYFSHDYNARNDFKVLFLRQQLGIEGYGIYWFLIESLAESGGILPLKIIPVLAMQMQVTETKVSGVINSFDLFQVTDNEFFSVRLNKHLEKRNLLSEKGKEGAILRWRNRDAIGDAIGNPNAKERKGNKVKEIKESKVNELESIQTRTKDFKDITNYKNCQLYEYHELNDEFKKLYTESEWSAWKRFNKHLDDNCEYIRKIENQIKLKDYILIKKDFIDTKKITVNGFLDLLDSFNNYKPATDKYNSVYPALRGWLKNEIK